MANAKFAVSSTDRELIEKILTKAGYKVDFNDKNILETSNLTPILMEIDKKMSFLPKTIIRSKVDSFKNFFFIVGLKKLK